MYLERRWRGEAEGAAVEMARYQRWRGGGGGIEEREEVKRENDWLEGRGIFRKSRKIYAAFSNHV